MTNWKKWLYYITLVAVSAVFLFSTFRLVINNVEAQRSKNQMEESKKMYYNSDSSLLDEANDMNAESKDLSTDRITVDQTPLQVQDKFIPLLELNSDVNSWIKIDGTIIDFPVVQAEDNEYYLLKDLYQKNNLNGSVFMDYRNNIENDVKHYILYGHNTKTMFESLLYYESQWNFENHSIIEFDTLYDQENKWEIFSVYFTDVTDNYIKTDFESNEEFEEFITHIHDKSLHSKDVNLSVDDTILTLSTCTSKSKDSRFAVHARLIN